MEKLNQHKVLNGSAMRHCIGTPKRCKKIKMSRTPPVREAIVANLMAKTAIKVEKYSEIGNK